MRKIEYIRTSHREANRKIRVRLNEVYRKLNGRNRVLGWLWRVVVWIIIGVVYLVSWLAFVDTLFRDVKFTLHYMECEIGDMPPKESCKYLISKQQEYIRRLSYGSVSEKEQKRIDRVFEYLFAKYPTSAGEPLPDPVAERHSQMIDSIAGVKAAIEESSATDTERREQETERHKQVIGGIAEVKTVIDSVVGYTDRKTREDAEQQEHEAKQFADAEKRRERHRSRSGFEHNPEDFSPKLSDRQIAVLTEHMNGIGVFRRDVTEEEIMRLLLCEHKEPLQTTHNKIIAMIMKELSDCELITPKWQRVAADKKCFISKHGKPLTAKDLSAAKQTAELLKEKQYAMILDCIDAVKSAR